jgi:hypothetical protein
MNDARREMIESSRSLIDIFCCDHYDELCTGMKWTECLSKKKHEFKDFRYPDDQFKYELQERCIRKKNLLILKEEYKSIYAQTEVDEDDEDIRIE